MNSNQIVAISGVRNTGCKFVKEVIAKSVGMPLHANNPYFTSLVANYRVGKNCWEDVRAGFKNKERLVEFSASILNQYRAEISNYPLVCDNHLLLYFTDLAELIPGTKFIMMIRDPRDVVACKPSEASIHPYLEEFVNTYKIFKGQKELLGSSLLQLCYEDLITESNNAVEALEAFLQIKVDREFLRSEASEEKKRIGKIGHHLFNLDKDDQVIVNMHKKDIEHYSDFECFYGGVVEINDLKNLTLEEAKNQVKDLFNKENTDEALKLAKGDGRFKTPGTQGSATPQGQAVPGGGFPLIVAYEPVWAIGTGQVATVEQVGEVHQLLRQELDQLLGSELSQNIPLVYGGSVKPENGAELLAIPAVDGFLIGGASLDAKSFFALAQLGF